MSLHNIKFNISPGALLLLALVFYFCKPAFILAFFLAVLVHELGHVLALHLLGLEIRAVSLKAGGLCISYAGYCGEAAAIISALSGPLAGLLFAWGFSWLSAENEFSFCSLAAGISLALSLFNILPIPPLDGGCVLAALLRLLMGRERGERAAFLSGIAFAFALFTLGFIFALKGKGLALLAAALLLSPSFLWEYSTARPIHNSWVL